MINKIANIIGVIAGKIYEALSRIGTFMFQKPIQFILIVVAIIVIAYVIFRKKWKP